MGNDITTPGAAPAPVPPQASPIPPAPSAAAGGPISLPEPTAAAQVPLTSTLVKAPPSETSTENTAQENQPQEPADAKHAKKHAKKSESDSASPQKRVVSQSRSDVVWPIVIASVLTLLLMSLTVATYISSNKDSTAPSQNAAAQREQGAQPQALTRTDVTDAVDYAKDETAKLDALTMPASEDLSDASLGL